MNYTREHYADRKTEEGIVEHQHYLAEALHLRKRADRVAHQLHAEHQHREAHEAGADVLCPALFGEHYQQYACKRQQRRECRGVEQLYEEVVALNAREAEYPRRQSGADI